MSGRSDGGHGRLRGPRAGYEVVAAGHTYTKRTVRAFLERAGRTSIDVRTTTGAVAQAWRNGARQARLALLLQGLLEVELTRERARSVGTLLSRVGRRDVIDSSIIDAAVDGDEILTTDPDDIAALAHNSGKNLTVTRV